LRNTALKAKAIEQLGSKTLIMKNIENSFAAFHFSLFFWWAQADERDSDAE